MAVENGRDDAVNWPRSFRLNIFRLISDKRETVSQDGFSRYRERHESAGKCM